MIDLQEVRKTFAMGPTTVCALDGVSLKIRSGEFVSIVGRSGSGKSTLLNIIGCLDSPTSGHYTIDRQDVSGLSEPELARVRRKRLGFVFQGFNLISRNTAYSNVEKPLIYAGMDRRARKARVQEMMGLVGLSNRMEHYPAQMSGGQQQRVAIARALVANPDIIIADEPTGNLDSQTGHEVMALLADISNSGKTVILVTHDRTLDSYAGRVIEMADGKLLS